MSSRLGNVLYVTGCGLALVFGAYAWFVFQKTGGQSLGYAAFLAVPSVVAWLIGYACRYVLSEP